MGLCIFRTDYFPILFPIEGESHSKYIFCKKSVSKIYVSKIYEWLLKLSERLPLSYPKSLLPNISFWMIAYFHNRYNGSNTGKFFHLVQQ